MNSTILQNKYCSFKIPQIFEILNCTYLSEVLEKLFLKLCEFYSF